MELVVLGNSSRYLVPLGAGASYLLREEETRLLLDAGNGTARRLADEPEGARLSAALVSHFHRENLADLLPVAFALPPGAPLLVPQGALAKLMDVLRAQGHGQRAPHVEGVTARSHLNVGPLSIRFAKGSHGCPGVATRIDAPSGSLVYLADTGMRAWLAEFARGADLVVAHTLLLDADAGPSRETNLSAGDAGRLARTAGATRLALSHVPFYGSAAESLAEASAAFGGEVVLLKEGMRLAI